VRETVYIARELTRKILVTIGVPSLILFLLAGLASPPAHADVGVVLNESMDSSIDRITGTGHSAVYFSRICPESPVKLRLCGPGEHGSVMSNYINIGEDQSFEWNIVPLNIYLYGVEDARDRPVFASFNVKHLLEERYRKNYLSAYCASAACATSYKPEWREMVAATFIRSVYIFLVDTTVEQDKELIAEFNESVNKNRFNGFTRNCADFTQRVINSYFPHAARTDYINDFGMTSPKAIARSFTHYALRHPELNLRVLHFSQVPGTIKRSREVRAGTEQLVRSKKFLIPMGIFAYYELPAVAGSYVLTGRFNPHREFEKHPAVKKDSAGDNQVKVVSLDERAQVVGTSEDWKAYRKMFDDIVEKQLRDEAIDSRQELNRFFKHLDETGTPSIDENGRIWMQAPENGRTIKVGLSASTILAEDSDPQMAHELLLARISYVLKSPRHSREPLLEFQQDWSTLQRAAAKRDLILARNATPGKEERDSPQAVSDDD